MAAKKKPALTENQRIVAILLVTFIAVQAIGLYLGAKLISLPEITPTTNAGYGGLVFLQILIATALVLVVIKYWKRALRGLELVAVFFSSEIFFEALLIPWNLAGTAALIAAGAVTLSRVLWKNIITQDIAMTCSIIGVGALLGAYLGFLPAIILLGLLTVYDVLAVFQTKHMVTMAKAITEQQLAFTLAIPTKGHTFQLGGGDLVMPLVFSVAVMREFGPIVAGATAVGAMTFLMIFFAWLVDRPGRAYPALPPVTLGAICGWALAVIASVLL